MTTNTNYGIDYGNGTTNINKGTGIRFGVISANDVPFWYEIAEAEYPEATCPECGLEVTDNCELRDYLCKHCGKSWWAHNCISDEPIGYVVDERDLKAHSSETDIFILKSAYYTHAQFCSPCAPGACHLANPVDENGPRCYCFGHDWFDGSRAPYTVYRVSDGSIVEP